MGLYPRKVKGFRDIDPNLNALRWHIINKATEIYRRYGFEHWDTPVLEYAELLGKYLPDVDQVDQGVYSFKNPEIEPVYDELGNEMRDAANNVMMKQHYLTMRYDLTAPLARLYSEYVWDRFIHKQLKEGRAPLFRRYQYGPVFRFEAKLDPGRFREFWQLDFDTVGTDDVSVDAENVMVLADALENIGIARGKYIVKINNRKVVKGFLNSIGVEDEQLEQDILRIVDKADKIGIEGVAQELGKGRKDKQSGAFIAGLELDSTKIQKIIDFLGGFEQETKREQILKNLESLNIQNQTFDQGLEELYKIHNILSNLGYDELRAIIDPSLIRGMSYYTGPIFEVEYLGTYKDEKGQIRRVGSISGGGRYDGLVQRILGLRVPATGASIGVDRLAEVLMNQGFEYKATGPVLIITFDEQLMPNYQSIAKKLRDAGIETEIYYGASKGLKKQLQYADKKNSPLAILIGEDEIKQGVATVRDLKLGAELADKIKDKNEWKQRVQTQVQLDKLVDFVKEKL